MMHKEIDRARIREFLDLLGNERYDLRKYHRPVLVYKVADKTVFYSIWEEDLLNRFGIGNVDGWDYKEDTIFCPDWVIGIERDDLIAELDEDEENE
jgi:hypothetical protein